MRRTRMWVIALCVFLLGGTAGYFVGTAHVLHRMERGFPGPPGHDPVNGIMGMLTERLDLDKAQAEAIRPIVRDFVRETARLHAPALEREDELLVEASVRIEALLRPEQAARHRAMIEERLRHRQEFLKNIAK